MKPLSQSLTDLAARVNRPENSAVAGRERNQGALQRRREELDAEGAVVRAELARGEADQHAARS